MKKTLLERLRPFVYRAMYSKGHEQDKLDAQAIFEELEAAIARGDRGDYWKSQHDALRDRLETRIAELQTELDEAGEQIDEAGEQIDELVPDDVAAALYRSGTYNYNETQTLTIRGLLQDIAWDVA